MLLYFPGMVVLVDTIPLTSYFSFFIYFKNDFYTFISLPIPQKTTTNKHVENNLFILSSMMIKFL